MIYLMTNYVAIIILLFMLGIILTVVSAGVTLIVISNLKAYAKNPFSASFIVPFGTMFAAGLLVFISIFLLPTRFYIFNMMPASEQKIICLSPDAGAMANGGISAVRTACDAQKLNNDYNRGEMKNVYF